MSSNVAPMPLYDLLQQLKREIFKDLRVSLPGSIAAVNSDGTVDVTVGVMQNVSQRGMLTGVDYNYPTLSSCILLSSQGGGVGAIFPVKVGDECWVTFSDRCIDAWFQSGGPLPLPNFRMHDISDGFVTVGPNSSVNKLKTSLAIGEGGLCETKLDPLVVAGTGARVAIDPSTHKIDIANGVAGANSLHTIIASMPTALSTENTALKTLIAALQTLNTAFKTLNTALIADPGLNGLSHTALGVANTAIDTANTAIGVASTALDTANTSLSNVNTNLGTLLK